MKIAMDVAASEFATDSKPPKYDLNKKVCAWSTLCCCSRRVGTLRCRHLNRQVRYTLL